ncbi:hypothetical protein TorRG33x02_163490, partial [Trema orientale]
KGLEGATLVLRWCDAGKMMMAQQGRDGRFGVGTVRGRHSDGEQVSGEEGDKTSSGTLSFFFFNAWCFRSRASENHTSVWVSF